MGRVGVRLAAAVAATATAVGALVGCAPESPEAEPASPGALTVEVRGNVQPTIEPTDLSEPAVAELAGLSEATGFLMGTPVDIILEGEFPEQGATLTRSYAVPLPEDVAATFAYWDDGLEAWHAVPTTIATDRLTISATVDHFSIWNDFVSGSQQSLTAIRDGAAAAGQAVRQWTDNAWEAVKDSGEALHWSLGNIFSTRVELPECDLPTPNWVIDLPVGVEVNDPVRFCAGYDAADPDLLVVKARANRGYGFPAILTVNPAWEYNSTNENTLDSTIDNITGLDGAVGAVVAGLWADGRYVGPGEEISFGIPASALDGFDSEFLLELPAPSVGQFLTSTISQQLVAWGLGKADASLAAVIAVASCWDEMRNVNELGRAAGAIAGCFHDIEYEITTTLQSALLANGSTISTAEGAGKLIGRIGLVLALLPVAISAADYSAELAFPRSVRALTIDADISRATPAPGQLPDGATWLHDLVSDGSHTSGDEETAQAHRDGALVDVPNSTNQWVGCPNPSVTRYQFDEGQSGFKLSLAVQAHAPAAMNVNFRIILTDGSHHESMFDQTFTATQGMNPIELEVQMQGARALLVEAWTDYACGAASKGYASLLEAYSY